MEKNKKQIYHTDEGTLISCSRCGKELPEQDLYTFEGNPIRAEIRHTPCHSNSKESKVIMQ